MRLEVRHRRGVFDRLFPRAPERDPEALRFEHNDAETVIIAPRRLELEATHSDRVVSLEVPPFVPPLAKVWTTEEKGDVPAIDIPLKGGKAVARIWYGGKYTGVEIVRTGA
jgi:hypothetical protein